MRSNFTMTFFIAAILAAVAASVSIVLFTHTLPLGSHYIAGCNSSIPEPLIGFNALLRILREPYLMRVAFLPIYGVFFPFLWLAAAFGCKLRR